MANYTTIEAVVKKGKIYPVDASKLPSEGRLLLIVMDEKKPKIDPMHLKGLLGWLKTDISSVEWQKSIRAEWDER
jgi:hypothetical protein